LNDNSINLKNDDKSINLKMNDNNEGKDIKEWRKQHTNKPIHRLSSPKQKHCPFKYSISQLTLPLPKHKQKITAPLPSTTGRMPLWKNKPLLSSLPLATFGKND
jgi:hypothetical protein